MNFLRSLRGQLAVIIILVILLPVSVIGYYAITYRIAEKNMAADQGQQHNSALHDLEPLFKQLMPGAGDEQIRQLTPAINGILRYYPGVRASFFNGHMLYTFGNPGFARNRDDVLMVRTPDPEELSQFQAVLAKKQGVTTFLKEGVWPEPTSLETVVPVGVNKQGLLVLDSRLGQFFLESHRSGLAIAVSLTLGMAIGIFGIIWISFRLQRSITKIRLGLEKASQDLAIPLENQSGELGIVVSAINRMREELVNKHKLEEQLQRAERLAGLGQLVAGVAHEIRNPLGIMKGTVQLMKRDLETQPALHQYEEHLQILQEQINRQNRVVEELLGYARPVKPQFGPVSIPEVLDSVLSFLGPSLRQQGISLRKDIPAGLPHVQGDGEKLKQVFVNLLLNSKDALPQGGEIDIRAGLRDRQLIVRIADNGRGIAPGQLAQIFEPFFSTKETGTGLGLTIVKQLVELHHGTLTVESEPGQGAAFTVGLPLGGEHCADHPGD